jgi:CRISPR-associated protein Csx16
MKAYFVSRHPGAQEWAARQGIDSEIVAHVGDDLIAGLHPGDKVLGTLPVQMAAAVCARGAEYWHLELAVPPDLRGQEMSAELMEQLGARLVRYVVKAA